MSDWRDSANCLGINTELFFPDKGNNLDRSIVRICKACEVQKECLEFALSRPDIVGFWAGTTGRRSEEHTSELQSH